MTRKLTDKTKELCRRLRREQSAAEEKLWGILRGRRFAGAKFRRQHPIGSFVVDFYCDAAKLVVEVDGTVHEYKLGRDAARQRAIEAPGYRVLRVSDNEVFSEIDAVAERIRRAASPCDRCEPDG